MVYYFKPYSVEKDLGKAYNQYLELLPNDDDWACLIDGDVAFLIPDYGHLIQEVIGLYPDTGLFTCYTNRVGNLEQCYMGRISEDANMLNHRKIALMLSKEQRHKLKELKSIISGHVMIVQKKTWKEVGGFTEDHGILAIDNKFSKKILKAGKTIQLMRGLYALHFYRLDTGRHDKSHLK